MEDFNYKSIFELSDALDKKQFSCTELLQQVFVKIDKLEPSLNSFAFLDRERALEQAKESEKRQVQGVRISQLDGIPTSIKDLIAVRGMPQRFGSRSTDSEIKEVDAPSVERLRKAGAIILGKSTTSEFGCKAVGDNPLTGITTNPWDTNLTPGGSSAGAAAMVAGDIVPYAIGTDGGGSIRIPCSLCGLFGIKPQFGRVPVYPYSATPTLAHVGPITRTVAENALILEIISGFSIKDPFSLNSVSPKFFQNLSKDKKFKIAYSPTFGYAKPDDDILKMTEKAAKVLENIGHNVTVVDNVMADPHDLWSNEFYAGVMAKLDPVIKDSSHLLDPAVLQMLKNNLNTDLSTFYKKVLLRYEFREKINKFFDSFDLLISPTLPTTAFPVGQNLPPNISDRSIVTWVYYTYPFNLTGQPAASVPIGLSEVGLPVGLQVVGRFADEESIFSLCAQLEKNLEFKIQNLIPKGGKLK